MTNKCTVTDCRYNLRSVNECKLNIIRIGDRRECLSFSIDMKYLRGTLREHVNRLRGFAADSETEAIVSGPEYHTPSVIAGEKENRDCQE